MKTQLLKAFLLAVLLALSFGFAQTLSGSFVGADESHEASGSFQLVEEAGARSRVLRRLYGDRGPDLFVWLVKGDDTSNFVNLARLQSTDGTQRYAVPEDVNLDDFDRVIVWCRVFSFLFATAEFQQDQ